MKSLDDLLKDPDILNTLSQSHPVPTFGESIPLAAVLGGIKMENGHVISADSAISTFFMKTGNEKIWEQIWQEAARDIQCENIRLEGISVFRGEGDAQEIRYVVCFQYLLCFFSRFPLFFLFLHLFKKRNKYIFAAVGFG